MAHPKSKSASLLIIAILFCLLLASCRPETAGNTPAPVLTSLLPTPAESPTAAPTAGPTPPQRLTVCLGQEPKSLFLYGDGSVAARSVREAIYDGPFDLRSYDVQPVILEKKPSTADGDVRLETVQVKVGDAIASADGKLVNLEEGVTFLPSGCTDPSCAQTVSIAQSAGSPAGASIDQLVVQFKLRSGLSWSDGAPLTAADSVFSYEVARRLYPRARADLINHTQSYQAIDDTTVEWRGVPGYLDAQSNTFFFSPLPQHAWGSLSTDELLSADPVNRMPVGWGPYVIEEWTAGDHITLSKNPNYFRAVEGLPAFEQLVYRFIPDSRAALEALLAGECDLVDENGLRDLPGAELIQLQGEGRLAVVSAPGAAWEHADFELLPADPQKPALFGLKEVRQAVALCIDRQGIANTLFPGQALVPDSYVPPEHPLSNPEVTRYGFDPQAAAARLEEAGWQDSDGNPATPRLAAGVPGVPDGAPLAFTYLTLSGGERQQAAEMLRTSLAQCGVQANVSYLDPGQLFAPGPDGPIFGRKFDMAQFGWDTSFEPPCSLYTSAQIPGPYPEFPNGWGGGNAAGYSSAAFDQACMRARSSLPDSAAHLEAHRQAQAIFAEELPAIPLYLRPRLVVTRPGLCGVTVDPSAGSALWNLEAFRDGGGQSCSP